MDTILKAIADPTRRDILAKTSEGEVRAGDLATNFNMSRPAVSQHIRVLLDAGLLTLRCEGTSRLYSAKNAELKGVKSWLDKVWGRHLKAEAKAATAKKAAKKKKAAEKAKDKEKKSKASAKKSKKSKS